MLNYLLATTLGAQQVQTIPNKVEDHNGLAYSTIREVATMMKTVIYAPDSSPKGYGLTAVEVATVKPDAKFPGLTERTAVRLKYWNKTTNHAFEIVQLPTNDKTDSRFHTKWLGMKGYFEMMVKEGDTFVPRKVGGFDIALHSTLISDPSAMIMLERLVPIRPQL